MTASSTPLTARIRAARAECGLAERALDAGEEGARAWVESAHDKLNEPRKADSIGA